MVDPLIDPADLPALSAAEFDGLRTIDAADLLRLEYRDPDFLVRHQIVERGITLVTGDTGAGKTAYLIHACAAYVLHRPVAGRFAVRSGSRPILYLNGEMSATTLAQYLHQAQAGLGAVLPHGRMLFEGAEGLATFRFDTEGCARLVRLIDTIDPALIVFDTMRALFEVEENDAGDVRRPFSWLRTLCESRDLAVLVAHHLRKLSTVSNSDRERVAGSRDIIAAVDIHLALKSRDGRPLHALLVGKTRHPIDGVAAGTEWPISACLEPGSPPKSIIIAGEPTAVESSKEDAEAEILALLEGEGPLSVADLGANGGSRKRALEGLRQAGTVTECGKSGRKTLFGIPGLHANLVAPDQTRDRTRKKPSNDVGLNLVPPTKLVTTADESVDENASPPLKGGAPSLVVPDELGLGQDIYRDQVRDQTRRGSPGSENDSQKAARRATGEPS